MARKVPEGMTAFIIVWGGQIVSVLASTMSQFGLTLWMYKQTQSATALGLMQVFFVTPILVISPIAGVMVDRYNRKLMMMLSDLTAVIATAGVFVLILTGKLEFWHLYVAATLNGIGNAFQWPAYSAAISTMIPRDQLGRANGMMSLIDAIPGVIAPLFAGMLLPMIGLKGIIGIDVATFFLAIFTLTIVHIPQPKLTEEGHKSRGNFFKEAGYGFKYIFIRPSLLGLQIIFLFGNLFTGTAFAVIPAMILAKTNQNSLIFGSVQTAGAVGIIIGGVLVSAWGGFKQRIHGVLLGWAYCGLIGTAIMGLNFGLPLWVTGMILGGLCMPLINSSNQAIWQSKVSPDLQGRVFAARRLIAWLANPISPIIGGTLSDFVLEPAMRTSTGLSHIFGWLVGQGPGSGMGLLQIICGIVLMFVGLSGYFIPKIRHVEKLLPDFQPDPDKIEVSIT